MIKTPLSTVIGGAFWTPGATVIGGNTPTFDQQIQKLFANGEQGFAYDPDDLTTLYQDVAGTVPVTAAGQPVGLMLDKSHINIIVDEVDVDVTEWAGSAGRIDKKTIFSDNSQTNIGVFYDGAAIDGLKIVDLQYSITGGIVQICDAVGSRIQATSTASSGNLRAVFFPDRSSSPIGRIYFRLPTPNTTLVIEKLTIQTLTGNHAYQTTSAARPILQNNPSRIVYDGVDDKLIANLPTQLSGCTVIRSVPNVGTQILTGQTIPATHEDNTDHCGLLVINRALTPSETSTITAEFNKRAGV